ncbi:ATP-dependent DNA helicase, RecQ family [Indibacter alkaliphilus LW1]|uniref:ATP-dependent DNA helicase RecQ n=1 Tax=Indibacter alkaliphilus (strain CCUG 57479 / KCTC 22604 / LW1) TaxID=1189612 RepID=S2DCX4_INDAL|nr:ATP-dependent DNA helicase RecQ [Indibacter alkaliphilus]EOZ96779.1 ATP-dependent DNA helicase, RecQ family [Indibacter alkaliphilus LW1]
MKAQALHILQKVFGYSDFRPSQLEIVLSVLEKRDCIALLPTGGGKSICFQVPALAVEGICVVISPLIALMKDQVDNLRKRGVLATAVYSGMSKREIDTVLDNCIYGNYKFLYLSPERLKSDLFIERFKKMNVNLIAVDEAHCISQWGYDFRPPYLEIANIREFHPEVPCLALTASATIQVKEDIISKLQLQNPAVFVKSFSRANLSYTVRWAENKLEQAIEILKKVPGSAIVYVRNRKGTKDIASVFQRIGIEATFYHAGLDNTTRELRQTEWKSGKVRVMVATNAFGMGIDKPDVRMVIHVDLTENLENYYQEAGRAGRDERKAYAVLLTNEQDIQTLEERAAMAYPPLEFLRKVYQSLANYYRMAVGSGFMVSFDFNISEFTSNYNLDLLSVYNAIKVLQEEGLIEMNEGFYAPSALKFSVDHSSLYEFQIANARLDPVIKMLLRTYGGELFSDFLKIQEGKLSKSLNISENQLIKILEQLDSQGIIAYSKRKDQPQITFLTERYDAGKLPLNSKRIEERRQNAISKAKSMIAYLREKDVCRATQISNYFGEETEASCGICDVCVERRKSKEDQSVKLRNKILQTLRLGTLFSLHNIQEIPGLKKDDYTVRVLREMEDEGLIICEPNGNYKIKD